MKASKGMLVLAVLGFVACGSAAWAWNDHEENARQMVDTDTILCLTNTLTHQEKQELASLSNYADYHPLFAAYAKVFPRCVFRADQWERKGKLTFDAWQLMQGNDSEFGMMEAAQALQVSKGE